MAQSHAKTGLNWHNTDEPVPFPVYRCKATAQERPGHTHLCRREVDHKDFEHKCIGGFAWEPVGANSEA